jgi:general secretion pathway protein A
VREQLDRRTLISLLSDRIETPEQLLAQILHDFGVVSRDAHARERAPSSELRKTLRSFLESLGSLDASAVIVVDDAHELPPAVFDEVRALCETAHVSSLLQVVLVGSEKLAARLRHAENRALHQRVAVRSAMQPIPSAEIGDYIAHRLSIAGNARVEFDEAALSRVSAISRGVPLAINRICDRALSLGGASSAGVITESMVDAAGRELGLSGARPMLTALLGQLVVALFVAAFLVVGAAVAAWVFRDSVARAITRWESIPAPPDAARRLPPPLAPLRPPEGF